MVLAEGILASVLQSSCDCLSLGLRVSCLQPGKKSFPDETSSPPQEPPRPGAAGPAHFILNQSPSQRGWAWGELPPKPSPPGYKTQLRAFPSLMGYFLPAQIHLDWLMGSVFFFGQRVVPTKQSFFLIPPLSNCFRMDLISPRPGAGLGSLLT